MAITYTPPTVEAGTRSTLDVLQAGRKPDLKVDPAYLEENTVPLLRLTTKFNKRSTMQPKFSWFEKQIHPYWSAAAANSSSGATELTVSSGHGKYFQKGTVFWVPKLGLMCRVRAVSTDTLTIERGIGGTSGNDGTISTNDDIRMLGTAYAEGSDASLPRAVLEVEKYNYCQIFKTGLGGSNTMESSQMYWGRDRKSQRRDRRTDHAVEIESAFLTGERDEYTDPDTNEVVRTTRGVINQISSNVTNVGGALSEATMDQIISDTFRYHSRAGRTMKWGFVGSLAEVQINGFGRDKLQMRPSDQTYGINVTSYQAIGRRIDLMRHHLLEDNPLSGATATAYMGAMMLIIDPSSPAYRYMRDRDTKLKRDIAPNGADRWQDEYLTECGLEFVQELWNHKVTGIASA